MCSLVCFFCCATAPWAVLALVGALFVQQLLPPGLTCVIDPQTGVCKEATPHGGPAGPVACSEGLFVSVTKQPDLGVWRYGGAEPLTFAAWKKGTCSFYFSVSCGAMGPEIREKGSCGSGKHSEASEALGDTWEVCAQDGELTLTVSVVDMIFDVTMAAGTKVQGCVRITAAKALPMLSSVKGPVEQQVAAIMERKTAFGGCPMWTSKDDILQRAQDFRVAGGPLYGIAVHLHVQAIIGYVTEAKAGKELSLSLRHFMSVPMAAITLGDIYRYGGDTGPRLTCGVPSFGLFPLPMPFMVAVRHPDTAKLIADPTQKRKVTIGAGYSDVCFDTTLPVFMSAGEPPHTQVRKLWDTVGVATMHLGNLPDIRLSNSSFLKVQQMALGAVGMTVPQMNEVALAVTPLFLEKLWGRPPTDEEVDVISGYPTSGGLCIASPVLEKLPLLPSKVKTIRAAMLKFGQESPLGKRLAEEIQKPEYAELRASYADRPGGIVQTAIRNLGDASLFAGLVGTTVMTLNCLGKLSQGPEYVELFEENRTAFLLETMRLKTAVGGSQTAFLEPKEFTVLGEEVVLPAGSTIMQATGMSAGYDGGVFPQPEKFDSHRPNLGETQNFNGLTRYVLARDYANAPRFCPGALTALKIAAKVCGHFAPRVSR